MDLTMQADEVPPTKSCVLSFPICLLSLQYSQNPSEPIGRAARGRVVTCIPKSHPRCD